MSVTIPWWAIPALVGIVGTIVSFLWAGREGGGQYDMSPLVGCAMSAVCWCIALALALWMKP